MSTQTIGRKSKELLAITILLNIAAVGWYGFLLTDIQATQSRIFDLTNQIGAESAEGNTLTAKKTLTVDTALFREKLALYTVGRDGAVSFIELLETIGNDIGVRVVIESATTKELTLFPQNEELRLTLTATGTWSAVVRFLGLLELLPYKAKVEQVVVSKTPPLTRDPWRADFSLTIVKEK